MLPSVHHQPPDYSATLANPTCALLSVCDGVGLADVPFSVLLVTIWAFLQTYHRRWGACGGGQGLCGVSERFHNRVCRGPHLLEFPGMTSFSIFRMGLQLDVGFRSQLATSRMAVLW